MTEATVKEPLRVMFCIGVTQNFFDLPPTRIKAIWEGYVAMMDQLNTMEGVSIIGTMDDDRLMVGTSYSWPWTSYILADVVDYDTVVAGCNLFRTIKISEDEFLWKYGRIEARVGRKFIL